ncbi:glycosyltransferase family 39 protein [Pseudonocardia sp. GCM10023141]|uniref:glycosyltransferase family 39 protein n=1 Tax=Pseudonocardia sp. GCM10023141 TaxID=3252653 RepID=UPI00361703F0
MVSLAVTLGGAAVFWSLGKRLVPARTARWALIAYLVSPVVMTYGNAFMPDVTVLLFYLLTLLFFQRWLAQDRLVWLVSAAAAASVAALAKPTSLHVFLIMLLWLLISARDRLRRPSLYVGGAAALIAPAAWLWYSHDLYLQYGNTFGVISGGDSKFGTLAICTSSLFWTGNATIEGTLIYGIVGVPIALLGAWMAWKARGPVLLAAAFPALFVFYFAVGRYSSELGPQYHIFSLPFAALLIGIGIDGAAKWLRRRLAPRALREVLAVMTVVLLGAQSLMIFSASFRDTSGVYGACGAQLDQVSQPGDLVVIGTTSLAIDRGTPNNYQEPTIFYLADRKGWSLPADRYSSALLREHVAQGAKYFVNYDPSLVPAGSEIAGWLAADTIQVRSAAADGCDIWMLRPAGPA